MKADIYCNLHLSQSTFAGVAMNTVSLVLLLASGKHHTQLGFQFD